MITFAADKTQLTFFLAVLRRPYSAKSGPFPDESAHAIIDLLTYAAHLSPHAYLATRPNGVGIFLRERLCEQARACAVFCMEIRTDSQANLP